jgi:hypothetical protein
VVRQGEDDRVDVLAAEDFAEPAATLRRKPRLDVIELIPFLPDDCFADLRLPSSRVEEDPAEDGVLASNLAHLYLNAASDRPRQVLPTVEGRERALVQDLAATRA